MVTGTGLLAVTSGREQKNLESQQARELLSKRIQISFLTIASEKNSVNT